MAVPAARTGVREWWRSRFGGAFVRELVLILALLAFYKYGRTLVRNESAIAVKHARELIGFERDLRIFTEARIQDAVIGTGTAVEWLLNAYYLFAHVAVTAIAFFWLYARHPATYVRFRRVMIVMTVVGLAIHLLYPLAPPRMFPHLGFVDTGQVVGPASYGHGSAYSGFANQFAAMPSLHFGWALAVAWAAILASRSRLRWLVIAHPVLTLAAIVLTANHYWLDAIVAAFLFAGALLFDRWRIKRSSSPHSHRDERDEVMIDLVEHDDASPSIALGVPVDADRQTGTRVDAQ
jgi:PAP2 superfamily